MKDENNLNIFVYGTPAYPNVLDKIKTSDIINLNWEFFVKEKSIKNEEEESEEIIKKLNEISVNKRRNDVILLFLDKIDIVKLFIEKFDERCEPYHDLILASDKEINLNFHEIPERHKKYIRIAYYTNSKFDEILLELTKAYAYNNDLGDYFEVPKTVKSLDFLKTPDNKVCLINEKVRDKPCINFLFISKSCAEKDILINEIIEEQKVIEGKAKMIQKYYHNKIHLCLINSPDLEREDDYERIKQYLSHNLAIDAVFFVINSKSRTFNDEELDLLKRIRDIGIPIFFPITKCRYKKEALGFKSNIEMELQQNFGLKCNYLLDHIQILNLSDPESKSLPIGYGLEELKDIFIKYFDSLKQGLKEKEQTLDDNTKLLSSKKSYLFITWLFLGSFIPYLTNPIKYCFITSLAVTSAAFGAIICWVKNKIPPDVLRYVQFTSISIFGVLGNYLISETFKAKEKVGHCLKVCFGIGAGLVSSTCGWLGLRFLLGSYQSGYQRRWSSKKEQISVIDELLLLKKKND